MSGTGAGGTGGIPRPDAQASRTTSTTVSTLTLSNDSEFTITLKVTTTAGNPKTSASISTPSPTVNATPTASVESAEAGSSSGRSKGLGPGPIAGIAVGAALVAIIAGIGLFFFLRRRRRARAVHGRDEAGTEMIIAGKQVDDDGSGSGVHHSPTSQNPTQAIPPGQQQHPYELVDNAGQSSGSPFIAPAAAAAPVNTIDQDLIDRPVSPPLPDDVPDSSQRATPAQGVLAAGEARDGRGSVVSHEDPEMQWILEEERRAKERREQQELRGMR